MSQKSTISFLLGGIFIITSTLSIGLLTSGAGNLRQLFGSGGNANILGTFQLGGNAGKVTLMNSSEESIANGSGLYLDTSNNTLTGNVFLETVGWAEFGRGGNVVVTPPGDATNVIEPWAVSGVVWTENAGWITLDSLNGSYSGTYYMPVTNSFTGYAWSDTLGYISLGKGDGLTIGLIGAVRILGNIAGNKSSNTLTYNPGEKFDSVKFTPYLNEVKKNVALITRSLPANKFNIAPNSEITVNGVEFFKLAGGTVESGVGPAYKFDTLDGKVQTIIVEGADFYINNDIPEDTIFNKPRSIIVIKDSAGRGGNIYIDGSVSKIYSTLVAEGSIYSGSPTVLTNDTQAKITSLPANQLYIKGSVISRNTIGGSTNITNASCPYNVALCDRTTAIKYDFNYFRNFNPSEGIRGYKNSTLDSYSLIFEYDPRVLTIPPPGLNAQ